MRRAAPWALALALLLAACGLSDGEAQRRLTPLQQAIGTAALDDAAVKRLSAEKAQLEALTTELQASHHRKETARHDWLLGECQRLRSLFDEPGAWEEAERRLTLALARDPKFAAAHLSLGQLYLTGGFDMADRAEHAFVRALEESGETPLPAARKGLFMALYYQGRWAEALKEADRYVALAGEDDEIKKMREMAATNLKRGAAETK